MPDEARLLGAFALATFAALLATPAAIAVAHRTGFHDRPLGYKGHTAPTPYLGGAAVFFAFLVGALLLGDAAFSRLGPIVGGALALAALGTIDDRRSLPVSTRLVIEFAAAMWLWAAGLGWDLVDSDIVNLAITSVWVVGLVNAFNLMDNMDGAAATVAAVTALAVAAMALTKGDVPLAVMSLALCGACLGFLPYNLAGPARIFLGDGGSLAIGFIASATIMALPSGDPAWSDLLAACLLAGTPVIDTTLVMVSRWRAGVHLLRGGRDHLTHRLITRMGSPRAVAAMLGGVQAVLGIVAIGVVELGEGLVLAAWCTWLAVAVASIVVLESTGWAPERTADTSALPIDTSQGARRSPRLGPRVVEAVLIAFISFTCGLSPFLYGFYDVGVWGPIALILLAGLLGLVIARPATPRRPAVAAALALGGLWLWSLLSTGWAESADQALTEANRWLLYAALFGVLILLLRDDRLGRVVLAAATAAILVLGIYLAGRMAVGAGSDLFLGRRLNEPLGYVNGQAGYLLMGVWPLIAVAERPRNAIASGLALPGAALLVGLVVLSQTRAVVPAILISAAVIVAVVPERSRRMWALLFVAAGAIAALPELLDVYDTTPQGRTPSDSVLQTAAWTLIATSAAAGLIWAVAARTWVAVRELVPRVGRKALVALPVACVVLAVGLVVAQADDPFGRVEAEYRNFVELKTAGGDDTRFGSGGGHRYDYWRIAANQFSAEPLKGVGAGNYDRTYFLERRTTEDIRQAHSIELQMLGELGLVGAALLALFLGAIAVGFGRRVRLARGDPLDRGLVIAGGGGFLVWLVQTSVDWLHLIPGVTGLALCCAAVLVAPWRLERSSPNRRFRAVAVVLCALAVVAGAFFVGRSALAERYLDQGRESLPLDPVRAIAKAADTLALDDERVPAYYLEAAGWARLGDYGRARSALREAAAREPHDFVTWALLGDLATRRGDRRRAGRAYRRALALNPRDPALAEAVREARAGAGAG